MVQDTLRFASEKLAEGHSVALVVVAETQGSSPANPGQMMAVLADKTTAGTVGGGASEHRLVQQAVAAINQNTPSFTFDIDHGDEGMVCGGSMRGYGTVMGAGPRLVLFGGGHVAQQIAPLAKNVGFLVTVVEDRPKLKEAFADLRYLVARPDEYANAVPLDANTYVVICTRGHRTDDDALRYCLDKPCAYLGMIGSVRKVTALFEALRAEGQPEEALRRVYAPVGLDVASDSPAEIAVAVVAEMLLVKNRGSAAHKKIF